MTVRETVVVRTRLPLVPVIVNVTVPTVAVDVAVRVRVDDTVPSAGGVTGLRLKDAETPLGRPETVSEVELLKPPAEVTVTVVEEVAP